jgi:hypothetical protein
MHYTQKLNLMFSKTRVKFVSSKIFRNYMIQHDDFIHEYYDTVAGTRDNDDSLSC